MHRKLKPNALGSSILVLAMLAASGLAQATVTSLSVNHKAPASADHTSVTMTGTLVCTAGDTAAIVAEAIQAKSATVGANTTLATFTCTGSAQDWSADVPVLIPAGGTYTNGPATAFVEALDTTDGTDQIAIAKLVITGAKGH